MNKDIEYKEDSCPYCRKKVMVKLNSMFFGDQRICSECQNKNNSTSFIKENIK